MKVVLFCGGEGMRMREFSEQIPKPMAPIGYRPIIWHVMKYYAHYGHKDFILCLGYKANVIKDYFLNYDECKSNDFTLSGNGNGREEIAMSNTDIDDWTITFVDTGVPTSIGGRLMAVREYLKDEKMFLVNYSDNLTNAPLPDIIDFHRKMGGVATFLCAPPSQTFHIVTMNGRCQVKNIEYAAESGIIINGGHFVFNQEIFDYMEPGDELVEAPFQRLIAEKKLVGYLHNDFFVSMDTFKERQAIDDMFVNDCAPWAVWDARKIRNIGK